MGKTTAIDGRMFWVISCPICKSPLNCIKSDLLPYSKAYYYECKQFSIEIRIKTIKD